MRSPSVLLHIPHSSTLVPMQELGKMKLSDEELRREIVVQTDWYTDELFDLPSFHADRLLFPVSRMVVDPERFRNDLEEPMAERGLGAVYSRTHDGRVLREGHDREETLRRWYDPHHAGLNEWTRRTLAIEGHALIIDCHSFPSSPLPCDLDQRFGRPDACIGTDLFHTPEWLSDCACSALSAQNWDVETNWPYSGSLTPGAYYRKDVRVHSVMVELNRRLYLDERTGNKLAFFDTVKSLLLEAVTVIVEEWQRRANPSGSFKLLVEDNFHHMDEQERYTAGAFGSYDEALADAWRITERSVVEAEFKFETYTGFGEDPWISPSPERRRFSAWEYARLLCERG